MLEITDQTFQSEVLESDKPVLVDFWAQWCGPCKMIAPILDEIAEEVPGIKIVKINMDEHNRSAMQYGVRSLPTLLIFKDGVVHSTRTGSASKTVLLDFINESL